MKPKIQAIVLLLGVAVGGVCVMFGATTAVPTATMTVPTILDLAISPTTIDFGSIVLADFTAGGKTLTGNNTLTIQSNGPNSPAWSVAIQANAATWTGGSTTKVAADLQVKKNTDGSGWTTSAPYATTLTGLSTTSATYATGTRGVRTSSQDYKALLSLTTDIPGTYTLSITYTASTL